MSASRIFPLILTIFLSYAFCDNVLNDLSWLKTTISASLKPENDLLSTFTNFPITLKNVENYFRNKLLCASCSNFFDFLIGKIKSVESQKMILDILHFTCVNVVKETDRVCGGYVDIFMEAFLYAVEHRANLSSFRVCGLIFQRFGCSSGDNFQWSVTLPSGGQQPNVASLKRQSFTILHISDLHYDPNYTPYGNANCNEPLCCQSDQKKPNSTEEMCGIWGEYNKSDSSWKLLEATIAQTKMKQFDYVYYTGDTISHRAWDHTQERHSKILKKIHAYFKESYNVPVFPIFGNHDVYPLDQWSPLKTPKNNLSWLYKIAAEDWSDLIGEDISGIVSKNGYYTVSPRAGFRIIALNSNLADNHNLWLLYDDTYLQEQLQWLVDILTQAEEKQEFVHILSHVPVGISDSLKVWDQQFHRIVERFANVITGIFNGHTHSDQFQIFYDSGNLSRPINVAFNGASVTTFTQLNPTFRYYEVDGNNFSVLDFEEFTFNLTEANLFYGEFLPWYKLYSFREAYNVKNLTASEMDKVVRKMVKSPIFLEKYIRFYSRDSDEFLKTGCNGRCQQNFLCEIVVIAHGDDVKCKEIVKMFRIL